MAELTNFPFSEIWAFGCWELWCLPLQSSQRLPSFTLCLIICFSGSGETSNICFKTLLARHCLPRLMCFITNSIIQWPQNLKVLLWQASICGTVPGGTWSHSFHRKQWLRGKGHLRYTLLIWSECLSGNKARPLLGEWKQPGFSFQLAF